MLTRSLFEGCEDATGRWKLFQSVHLGPETEVTLPAYILGIVQAKTIVLCLIVATHLVSGRHSSPLAGFSFSANWKPIGRHSLSLSRESSASLIIWATRTCHYSIKRIFRREFCDSWMWLCEMGQLQGLGAGQRRNSPSIQIDRFQMASSAD